MCCFVRKLRYWIRVHRSGGHNKPQKELRNLYYSIEQDKEFCEQLYTRLLNEPSEKVLLAAATDCLALRLFVPKAIENLEQIERTTQNRNCRISASIVLKLWKEQGVITR